MADERGEECLALALQAGGIDNAQIVEQAQIDAFARILAQVEQHRRRPLDQLVQA